MSEYQLEIKQIVDHPFCRVYRKFIRSLIADRSIRTNNGCSGLFYFTALCSYANFRTSYRHLDGISYTVCPGEWVCRVKEILSWLRSKRQLISVLDILQNSHLIQYEVLGRGGVVRYKISGWRRLRSVHEMDVLYEHGAPKYVFELTLTAPHEGCSFYTAVGVFRRNDSTAIYLPLCLSTVRNIF